MDGKADPVFSEYIIDGTQMDTTPADSLRDCMYGGAWEEFLKRYRKGIPETGVRKRAIVIDELIDPAPEKFSYCRDDIPKYIRKVAEASGEKDSVNLTHPRSSTRIKVAGALLDTLWEKGEFHLEDIKLKALWRWDTKPVGNMSSFYMSTVSAAQYIYDLGVKISDLSVETGEDCHQAVIEAQVPDEVSERLCPEILTDMVDCSSWLIYVPFDTCPHRLGGSSFAEVLGRGNETGPEILDPDYFMDCYEVMRELVEDGVAVCGRTVARGGIAKALTLMLGDAAALETDLSGIGKAYLEDDPARILFAEIPGVIIQIKDNDYDYVDSQFLLQDIAYYPLGHPVAVTDRNQSGIRLSQTGRTDLSSILASLMNGLSSEGED